MLHETQQITDTVLMVRPAHFGYNEETADSNAFQRTDDALTSETVQARAAAEFDGMVAGLRAAGVEVIVIDDRPEVYTPDAVFPNNWVTFHEDGSVITYPMYSAKRRMERRADIIEMLSRQYRIEDRLKMEWHERENRFLEGTGSMILDRPNHIVYACLSERTDEELLEEFCLFSGYEKVLFHAMDGQGKPIYHTNVMMALGETFAVVALDTLPIPAERAKLLAFLHHTHKEVIEISIAQMMSFAGNMLQVRSKAGETFLVMSQQAYASLSGEQLARIEAHTRILTANIPTIEMYGGGSVRCMMAEVFLQKV
ncbi:MAG: citrulline utilization hydrolase CtlX [Saprospiraceae bacterium]